MGVRAWMATQAIRTARSFGNVLGCEMKVELSDHSIELSMVHPNTFGQAWDPDFYVRGNVFRKGYANPIKPTVDQNKKLSTPDTVDIENANEPVGDGSGRHVSMISSPRYRMYMVQDLVSQLLNPQERLKLIMYILVGIAGIVLLSFLMILTIAGSVGVF